MKRDDIDKALDETKLPPVELFLVFHKFGLNAIDGVIPHDQHTTVSNAGLVEWLIRVYNMPKQQAKEALVHDALKKAEALLRQQGSPRCIELADLIKATNPKPSRNRRGQSQKDQSTCDDHT